MAQLPVRPHLLMAPQEAPEAPPEAAKEHRRRLRKQPEQRRMAHQPALPGPPLHASLFLDRLPSYNNRPSKRPFHPFFWKDFQGKCQWSRGKQLLERASSGGSRHQTARRGLLELAEGIGVEEEDQQDVLSDVLDALHGGHQPVPAHHHLALPLK